MNLTELVRSSALRFVGVLDLELLSLSEDSFLLRLLSDFLEDLDDLSSLSGPVYTPRRRLLSEDAPAEAEAEEEAEAEA